MFNENIQQTNFDLLDLEIEELEQRIELGAYQPTDPDPEPEPVPDPECTFKIDFECKEDIDIW